MASGAEVIWPTFQKTRGVRKGNEDSSDGQRIPECEEKNAFSEGEIKNSVSFEKWMWRTWALAGASLNQVEL